MNMIKQGREINTKISDVFKTSYGTVDVSSLKSIYLNLSSLYQKRLIFSLNQPLLKPQPQYKRLSLPIILNMLISLL